MTAERADLLARLDERFALREDEGSSKVMDLRTAVRSHVKPGDVLHIGYSDARPNAAIMETVRAFAGAEPRFTVVSAGLVSAQHSLVELALARKLIVSFAGENYPAARPNPALVRAVAAGAVDIEHWSLWSLIARLVGGALGVPWFPVQSMRGSDMGREAEERGELVELDPDGSGRPFCVVKSLRPDVVLLHAAAADAHGNLILAAPYGESAWGSLAARRGVIATVERVISTEQLRKAKALVRIPAHAVLAVCEAPQGAHPYGFNDPGVPEGSSYVEDTAFIAECLAASATTDGFRRWIEEWVLGVSDHEGYLAKLGPNRVAALQAGRDEGAWRERVTPAWAPDLPATATETQVVVTARRLQRSVVRHGYQAVLAGVGLANLASWVGVEALHRDGVDIELMAEIGLFGYAPRPGQPFIFAGQNVPTNKILTDVMGVLGTLVSGPGTRTIGVLGAGQIDASGAVNSTYAGDGSFIVGSGGANDVMSAADDVIVTVAHQESRLVRDVSYVTCPGDRVSTIVTDLCVFERRDGGFVVTRLLPTAGTDIGVALENIRSRTGWPVVADEHLDFEAPPTPAELEALRVYDPDLVFLRGRGRGADHTAPDHTAPSE
jgi:acyl CoA:acetate/3-ketoacid CoA transferase alpha subunit/acyl CoA:acetate/3-ketoacid CoA transferase beta subunit